MRSGKTRRSLCGYAEFHLIPSPSVHLIRSQKRQSIERQRATFDDSAALTAGLSYEIDENVFLTEKNQLSLSDRHAPTAITILAQSGTQKYLPDDELLRRSFLQCPVGRL